MLWARSPISGRTRNPDPHRKSVETREERRPIKSLATTSFLLFLNRPELERAGRAYQLPKLRAFPDRVKVPVLLQQLEAISLAKRRLEITKRLHAVFRILPGSQCVDTGHLVLRGGSEISCQGVVGILVRGLPLLQSKKS